MDRPHRAHRGRAQTDHRGDSGSDSPQIEMTLRNTDRERHWALWNLGKTVSLRPGFDYPAEPRHA